MSEKHFKISKDRLLLMAAGLQELQQWLADMMRHGLAELPRQDASHWEAMAARLVDNKLGGVARRIRRLGRMEFDREEWAEHVLREAGQLYLLAKGFDHLEKLPGSLQEELLNLAGWSYRRKDLEAQEPLADQWLILGCTTGEEEQLYYRKSWMYGLHSGRLAYELEFNFGAPEFSNPYLPGRITEGEACFYPGAAPHRLFLKTLRLLPPDPAALQLPGAATFEEFLSQYARTLSENPWLAGFPAILLQTVPVPARDGWLLADATFSTIRLDCPDRAFWELSGLSGGHPVTVAGEWNGVALRPLGAQSSSGRYVSISAFDN